MPSEEHDNRVIELRRRIFQIERLAAMPHVVWQLMEALANENTSADRLEKIIESDVAVASKILSLANSAYYSFAQEVTTIRRAIVLIGFKELEFLALGAGLAEVFDLRRVPQGMDGEGLWIHCMGVAWMAKELAVSAGYPTPGEILIGGLLHDLGKLVLATHLADELAAVLELSQEGMTYFEAEELLGVSHTTVGYLLALRWGLPPIHASAIRDHHSIQTSDPYLRSTCLVLMADHLVKKIGLGLAQQSRPTDWHEALRGAKIGPDDVRAVARKASETLPPMAGTWRQMLVQGEA